MEDFLKHIDIFSGLDAVEISRLAGIAVEKKFKKGDVIFNEGDKGDSFYVVSAGMVEIGKTEDNPNKFYRLARLEKGEIFGELSIFDEKPRAATARVSIIPEATLLIFHKESFDRLVSDNPGMGLKLVKNMLVKISQRLRVADDAIQTLLRSLDYSWI